ncbi:MAG: replication-associated recombination protein A [Saprospiraceae bacterium]|nr:replication-associated recombination protein A [Saprospiraceae bacterium]MBK7797269.1 replication-associated recombination protein A [Saprospiraceae bacterium]MBK9377755.1 replication-associated recombination protein A [Saprospiraceae bacterium]MBL0261636.1 replication-associated recombination protein A [Saprospiraceae bacterium]
MQPLAERMRPKSLDEIIGQKQLVGPDAALKNTLLQGHVPSMILWGPPGVGKTTLARIIASEMKRPFHILSAVQAGVKEVREAIQKAESSKFFQQNSSILFIDEIHRFNKSQQDALLGAVENGTIALIGATTENPSFEVNSALLSRCQVYILEPIADDDMLLLCERIVQKDYLFEAKKIHFDELNAVLHFSSGDARKLCNILEMIGHLPDPEIHITDDLIAQLVQKNIAKYDKNGDQHYDIASAMIKSIRGSDPQAAVYWMARMIDSGEDVRFISRRLLISAAEDIGLANPNALLLAEAGARAAEMVGFPESRIILSEVCIYLACSSKSNSAYMAIQGAMQSSAQSGHQAVPLHLRNAPTTLMKKLNYGKEYRYSHDYENHFVEQEYMPESLSHQSFYIPANNPAEEKIRAQLLEKWKNKYKL